MMRTWSHSLVYHDCLFVNYWNIMMVRAIILLSYDILFILAQTFSLEMLITDNTMCALNKFRLVSFLHKYCLIFVSFIAAGLVPGMGLVNIFGRSWPTNLQIPESQPSHCFSITREVSGSQHLCLPVFISISYKTLFSLFCCWCCCSESTRGRCPFLAIICYTVPISAVFQWQSVILVHIWLFQTF